MHVNVRFRTLACALGFVALGMAPLHGQAIISNGTIKLGVREFGSLNTPGAVNSVENETVVGVRFLTGGKEYESTADGCKCEGWGAGVAGGTSDGVFGQSSVDNGGDVGVTGQSFASTATTATSVVTIGGVMRVTHEYLPSSSPNLYAVKVTIENLTGSELGVGTHGIRYRRVMDWDIEPTAFSEFVTLHGTGATNLLHTSDDGFEDASPFASLGTGLCAPVDADFANQGPCDHGALFDFGFPALAAHDSRVFETFYGAAATNTDMLAALSAVGAEVFTTAHCNPARDACTAGDANRTFAYGFKGVGGTPLPPSTTTPEPISMVLMGTGLVGLAAARRRRQQG